MQLHLAHEALHAEHEAVVGILGIVQTVLVGQQGAANPTHLEEIVPITGRAGQPTHLQAEYQANVIERHLAHKPLKAAPPFGRAATLAEVFVDDQDTLPRPPERHSMFGEGILSGSRFTILLHLVRCRLPYINDRQPVEVGRQTLDEGTRPGVLAGGG